jgi:hypothetical protein
MPGLTILTGSYRNDDETATEMVSSEFNIKCLLLFLVGAQGSVVG